MGQGERDTMINAQINTVAATQFGASVSTSLGIIGERNIRLTTTANGSQILVWDMTEKQAFLLYSRLKKELGFIHEQGCIECGATTSHLLSCSARVENG
jgi:hypothetical protein